MNLATRIKTVAREHGKTITQIAEALNVLQPQLSRTINNPRISLEDLNKLAEAIGCKVSDFFRDEIEVSSPQNICPYCGKTIIIKTELIKGKEE